MLYQHIQVLLIIWVHVVIQVRIYIELKIKLIFFIASTLPQYLASYSQSQLNMMNQTNENIISTYSIARDYPSSFGKTIINMLRTKRKIDFFFSLDSVADPENQ
jgi:hypothetical protein